ncbi:MAG: tyrosine-type recombinase/integrase [Rhodospirillales bacterium]
MLKPITKRAVDAMGPDDIIADTQVQGFVARCQPSGKITYGFRYRQRSTGKRRWIALGHHGQITPDQARTIAQKHAGVVADGGDPLGEKIVERAKAKAAKTVGDVIDMYVTEHARAKKLRSADETSSFFDRLVKPKIGALPLYDLRKSNIVEMLGAIESRNGPFLADRMLAHVRAALNWYEASGKDDDYRAPVFRRMARTTRDDRTRTRVLTDDELREISAALQFVSPTFAAIVRVLMLTAQRRDEIACMKHSEISNGCLTIPGSRYKTGDDHLVPLTDGILAIIEAQPKWAKCKFVFSTNGESPFQGFSKSKAALDKAINQARKKAGNDTPIPDWRLHDLRRTARTKLSALGVSTEIAERTLGHKLQGIEAVYNQHAYEAEKRDALERLGAAIERILNPPTGNVVEFGKVKSGSGPSE